MAETVTHKGLYAALAAAQLEMGRALKDSTNPAFRSKYADLASVCDACMPALNKHGIAVLQPVFDDESGRYVKTIFVHGESGEQVECRVPLIVGKNDMQGYGSAVTYGRRYGLMGMAGIAPEDDDGNAAAKAAPRSEPKSDRPKNQDAIDGVHEKSVADARVMIDAAETVDDLNAAWKTFSATVRANQSVIDSGRMRKAVIQAMYEGSKFEQDRRKADLQTKPADDLGGDSLPY
jgi:hypothetical protein